MSKFIPKTYISTTANEKRKKDSKTMTETPFFMGKAAEILTAQAKYQKYFLTFGQIIKLWFQIFDVLWGIPENSMGFDCNYQKDNRAQN